MRVRCVTAAIAVISTNRSNGPSGLCGPLVAMMWSESQTESKPCWSARRASSITASTPRSG